MVGLIEGMKDVSRRWGFKFSILDCDDVLHMIVFYVDAAPLEKLSSLRVCRIPSFTQEMDLTKFKTQANFQRRLGRGG